MTQGSDAADGERGLEVGLSVALHGDLTFETADRWHEVARSALDAQPSKVTVDLRDVTFLDSSGMYVLVQLRRHASELGVAMEVVNVPRNVHLALRTADLLEYLGVPAAPPADRDSNRGDAGTSTACPDRIKTRARATAALMSVTPPQRCSRRIRTRNRRTPPSATGSVRKPIATPLPPRRRCRTRRPCRSSCRDLRGAASGARVREVERSARRTVVTSELDGVAAGDLSDQLIARPDSTQDVLERIMEALERIEAKIDGTWQEGPNPL